jgi:hypothetical protein
MFNKPCLDCGVLVRGGSRCPIHQAMWQSKVDAKRKPKRTHYDSKYKRDSKIVRDNAIECWLCGQGYRPDDPWTADHLFPGVIDSPLLPAHRSCNSSRGNRPPDGVGLI